MNTNSKHLAIKVSVGILMMLIYSNALKAQFENLKFEYLTTDNSDLLPSASIMPIGKQKIKEKNETMNVRESPPQAPVSTHSKPNAPPDIK